MNDLRIDRLRWWHLPAVAEMETAIFGPEAWSEGLLWTELSAGNDYRAVFDGERILGYAGTALNGDELWLNNIAVSAEARRRGVARMLMDDLIARGRGHGVKSVYLEVAVDNVPAQRLYDGYGFYGIGLRKNYYQHTGTDAAVMRMDL
ncbi:ribosomal protein S18-alanine N-acetyltransferase [Glycomyces algeriensis]|uniref:ribosomal protein S18-alanine N-acetyltransferase n=1 Tax=Glycomyces algeriensis TaxID=256037 RepID=UPI0022DB8483|nr:ribosomal protein S18-alanine N-acetyltransferase [Glycomyces algeriensis]MDA1367191.1 ribosomal protein S18-alanine N-acetyltransferase [Glycomyces algeriensis]MDR7353425.1 ribosomal-protein-alanine N-acetyltransferase [Glycomyces algeriensis]